jgi:Kef-type K+ transport system membrane component KefB
MRPAIPLARNAMTDLLPLILILLLAAVVVVILFRGLNLPPMLG